MVAQQATEFAPGPLFGNQLKAAVAGVAVGTGDVGFLHRIKYALAAEPIKPGSYLRYIGDPVQRSKAQQAALSDK